MDATPSGHPPFRYRQADRRAHVMPTSTTVAALQLGSAACPKWLGNSSTVGFKKLGCHGMFVDAMPHDRIGRMAGRKKTGPLQATLPSPRLPADVDFMNQNPAARFPSTTPTIRSHRADRQHCIKFKRVPGRSFLPGKRRIAERAVSGNGGLWAFVQGSSGLKEEKLYLPGFPTHNSKAKRIEDSARFYPEPTTTREDVDYIDTDTVRSDHHGPTWMRAEKINSVAHPASARIISRKRKE